MSWIKRMYDVSDLPKVMSWEKFSGRATTSSPPRKTRSQARLAVVLRPAAMDIPDWGPMPPTGR